MPCDYLPFLSHLPQHNRPRDQYSLLPAVTSMAFAPHSSSPTQLKLQQEEHHQNQPQQCEQRMQHQLEQAYKERNQANLELQHQEQQQQQQPQQPPFPISPCPSPSRFNQLVPLASYPPPLASHEQVVAGRDVFYEALNKFHAALGTRLMIPTIGGKELDLHLLYVEVSSRGGLEQVIRERKWKEVTLAFNFPPTTTSASFVLRKYYVALLHHFEQVYYFGAQGQLVPAPEDVDTVVKKRRQHRGTVEPSKSYGVDLGSSVGHMVSGVIDGKFEHGYLVTVTVGSEELRGVLYHMPSGTLAPQFAAVSGIANGTELDALPEGRRRRRRRRKDEMRRKDPNAPKLNRSGYNFFFQEQHMRLKALHPDKDKEISRMIGELWNKQTEEERAVYQELGVKDKERYKREMEEYRGKQAECKGSRVLMELAIEPSRGNVDMNEEVLDNREICMMEEHQTCTVIGPKEERPHTDNEPMPASLPPANIE